MKRAIGSPTKAQSAYHDTCRSLVCVVCLFRIRAGLQINRWCGAPNLHHRNLGDKHGAPQLGHDSVVMLGAYHHDGVLLPGFTRASMYDAFGASYFHNAREFRQWTAEVLPGRGLGTEAWQWWMDRELERKQGRAA